MNRSKNSLKSRTHFKESFNHKIKFPQKLWDIVNDEKNSAIQWGPGGKTILVEYRKLQKEYLFSRNSIFKTRNFGSFVRQLNLYGFRKVTSFYRDSFGNIQRPHVHEYLHDCFQANRKELLQHVCRKSNVKPKKSAKEKFYFHDLEENKVNSHKSSLQECQTALTKALEQAVCDYRKKKYSKYPKEVENIYLECELTPQQIGTGKSKELEQKIFEPAIPINADNIVYRIPQDYSHILIPIKDNIDFQVCFQNVL